MSFSSSSILLRRITSSCTTRRCTNNNITATSITTTTTTSTPTRRTYITRAHPSPRPTAPIQPALDTLLSTVEARHNSRSQRWNNNKENRIEQQISYITKRGPAGSPTPDEIRTEGNTQPYRGMDETIELALQLNLDPRKPGQSLRGSLALPHGNGKKFNVVVFTTDVTLASEAKDRGAIAAGGEELIDSILNGTLPVSTFQRTLASPDIMSNLSAIARILGPRGLMPNPKLNTIIPHDEMLNALDQQMSGMSNYRTDKEGIIRLGIGKGSFGKNKLLDNIREIMNEVQSVKPDSFGKGKKGKNKSKQSKGTKYYLKAHLSSTQSKGSLAVDMRTLDPTNSFFMSDPL